MADPEVGSTMANPTDDRAQVDLPPEGPFKGGGTSDADYGGGESTGTSPSGGGSGGGGGAGGNFNDGGAGGDKPPPPPPPSPVPDECAQKANERVTAAMAVEDTNALAAPAYVRDILKSENGDTPSAKLVKTHELFNYYALPYTAAEPGFVGVTAGLWETTPGSGEYRVVVGVTAPPAQPRPRVNVSIVVDTSVSMTNTGMTRARAIVKAIGESLREGDVVSLVTWNPAAEPLLAGRVVTGPDDPELTLALNKLYADGGTDLQAGLLRGYELADKSFDKDGLNRLVFISDGRVTAGNPWEQNIIQTHVMEGANKVLLVGAATGPGAGYDETLMTTFTGWGLGSYVYVDSEAEATRLFHDRFDEVMGEPMYDGVTLTLDVPRYFELVDFVDQESPSYSPDPSKIKGRSLAAGDSMTFNQIVKACHPLVIKGEDKVILKLAWTERATGNPGSTTVELTMVDLLNSSHPGIRKANAIALFAEALQLNGGNGDPVALGDAWAQINTINDLFKPEAGEPGDPELEEILALLKRHPKYSPPAQP